MSQKVRSAVHNLAATGSVSQPSTVLFPLRIPSLRGNGLQSLSKVVGPSSTVEEIAPLRGTANRFSTESAVHGRVSLIRGYER
ncbi:hypothetical protein J1614_009855 [Plenodomus biglobosus]|nr:hypothetical protein J1614_009855 [Plenodomus biglobosus]